MICYTEIHKDFNYSIYFDSVKRINNQPHTVIECLKFQIKYVVFMKDISDKIKIAIDFVFLQLKL